MFRHARLIVPLTMLAAVALMLMVACQGGPAEPEASGGGSTPVPTLEYLTEDIPPCTPISGSTVDPCEPDVLVRVPAIGGPGGGDWVYDWNQPFTIRDMLDGVLTFIPHIVLRGTYVPDTGRCTADNPPRPASYVEKHYFSTQSAIQCYVDIRVNSYILGSGPSQLTIQVSFYHYWEGEFAQIAADQNKTVDQIIEEFRAAHAFTLDISTRAVGSQGIYGREVILFIGPPHNHAVEAWEVFDTWAVQRNGDDTVMVVHPDRNAWRDNRPDVYQAHRSTLEMTLADFTRAVTAAHQARMTAYGGRVGPNDIQSKKAGVTLPMLVTDANMLVQYFSAVGTDRHPDGPPTSPPLACGTAVSDRTTEPGLTLDCQNLLTAKDTLRGTGSLNWSTGTAIASWDGVTVAGTPKRITKLKLANEGLTGSIPEQMADLTALTEIKLAGNPLTGCIPLGLKDVTTSDLSSLNLPYCQPPAPGNLRFGTAGETSIPLTWDSVPNASRYRVEYFSPLELDWVIGTDAITATTHTLSGLFCGTIQNFRVSAYGSGTTYAAEWSERSPVLTTMTTECVSPVFSEGSYAFTVAENSAAGAGVGTVSATDPQDNDTVSYSISGGNDGGAFAMGSSTGAITVVGALDFETNPTHTLTVQATDGSNSTTVAVEITVTDVVDTPPLAPSGVGATLAGETFTVSWTALDGAAKYEAQHTTDAADAATVTWTALPETTGVNATYAPEGGPACSTEYRFRVRAYGDGAAYTEMWGVESDVVSVETATCDPEFGQASYTFEVAEDAGVGDTVGTASATDPDEADNLTYSITEGNEDGNFAIDGSTGAITVAVALDYETTSEYTLTVEVSDGNGGSDTAAVTLTVIDVAEDAPPAPSGLDVTLADGTFTISWTALDGAAKYEVQHTTDAASAATVTWTALPETTGVNATYAPDGGPACSTEYRFRVRAYGDGETYTEMWGVESAAASVETATCDPEFGEDSYYFFILDTTAADSAVGTVPATDPDTNDTVSYAITGGNEDGKFAISTTTGQLTSAGTFDIASTPYYSLTVEASDGQGGTDTAEVTVSLTIAACANGTVVPRPEEYPRLVRDCSVLLTAKDTLRGTASLNWSADIPLRQWQGIYQGYLDSRASLDPATRHVTDVRVSSLGLNGSIPSLLTGLVDLRQLLLDHNALTGGIPAELGDLSGLSYLGLHRNLLTGEIPPELGNLSNLDNLRLHGNQLAGAMPSNLRALGSLRILILNNNRLTGSIPSWLSEMSELRELWLRDNQLTGAIPSALESLDLDDLHLSGNSFTGCIPAGLRDVADNDMDRMSLPDCSP